MYVRENIHFLETGFRAFVRVSEDFVLTPTPIRITVRLDGVRGWAIIGWEDSWSPVAPGSCFLAQGVLPSMGFCSIMGLSRVQISSNLGRNVERNQGAGTLALHPPLAVQFSAACLSWLSCSSPFIKLGIILPILAGSHSLSVPRLAQ